LRECHDIRARLLRARAGTAFTQQEKRRLAGPRGNRRPRAIAMARYKSFARDKGTRLIPPRNACWWKGSCGRGRREARGNKNGLGARDVTQQNDDRQTGRTRRVRNPRAGYRPAVISI